jgi:two-component system, chemotaxis family, sensor kinase CheA
MVEFDRSAFIAKFQEEAQDLLQRLNEGVIQLEAEPRNRELIDQMLRDAHTLKGSSRMVGLIEISDVAHALEDFMVQVRDGQIVYSSDYSDAVFAALDTIVYLADNSGDPAGAPFDLDSVKRGLVEAAAAALAAEQPATAPAEKPIPKPRAKGARGETGKTGGEIAADADADPDTDADVDEGSSVATAGDAADSPEDARELGEAERAQRDGELKEKVQTTIRVQTTQLDQLLNLISEVVIAQIKSEEHVAGVRGVYAHSLDAARAWARVKSLFSSIAGEELLATMSADLEALDNRLDHNVRELGTFVSSFADDVSRASVVVHELQEQGMVLRMLPANTIFQSFPRAVRDLARQFRKEIDFVVEGGETRLDKKILEQINDPLVHIMRNAVDHGVESREVREAAGKPRAGTVVLGARQEGDRIVIEVSDDGAGIDPKRIRESAVRKGYISEAEAAAMSDREAQYLIFEAGFSTAAIITEISGRGVGMDVVREFIVEKLKGSLDLESRLGEGTTFRLTIPLTLAIIRALLLRIGDQVFALPSASVEETLRVNPADIQRVEGMEVIRRQRRTIPLVRLSDLLGVPADPPGEKVPIATIGYSGHRMGFIVDAFLGEQQIVIKTLGSYLRKVDNIAGVTVLGAGQVVPILNVPDLMNNARSRSGQRVGLAQKPEREGVRRVLICEDSFTTRELERSIFEAAGYEVETANDGAQGLRLLREGIRVDAVITDVQMPNMTGFELTRAIKRDSLLQEIPVVIVTSLERDEEKAEGIEAGADAYITKSVFNQDTLLDTVERLVR